jgi:uncharacterized protein (TIGR02145 family)
MTQSLTKILISAFLFTGLISTAQTVQDIDGNVYLTVTIGTQVWMVENLKTTKFNDGAPIPTQKNDALWDALTTPAYCWYNNDSVSNKSTYGALYNWFAVKTGKLCPAGWHVATSNEWNDLVDFCGGQYAASSALREAGIAHWTSPNSDATNSSGFTALPAGYRMVAGSFSQKGGCANFWTSTEPGSGSANYRLLMYNSTEVKNLTFSNDEMYGFSVRCIRDLPTTNHETFDNQSTISIAHNTATNELTINCADSKASVVIHNITGAYVCSYPMSGETSVIDISTLSAGVYIVEVKYQKESLFRKIIIK